MDNEAVLQDLNQTVVRYVQNDIKRAEAYQGSVIERTVKERYAIYYADKEYYRNKFPILSKTSDLVSTDVADTIEWALPSLMKVFTGSDEVITIAGVTEEDDTKAETMQELLVYQLQRQNKFFPILYNWMKDALITGMGIVKCYWERTEGFTTEQAVLNNESLQALIETGVNVTDIQGPDAFGDFTVTYQSPYYVKNAPKIENILISEFIYSPDAKSLEEANFVAHKRKVTMSYLREREAQGVYANIDAIKPDSGYSVVTDPVQDVIGDNYNDIIGDEQKARQEVTIYECYTKIDVNNDGILEDMIITICGDTIIRMEQNYMGRHPFFAISPTKDPHRIWVKRSYAELIGELQDLKVALTRQIMQNVALTNDPKMLLDETAINIDDFVQGRKVIRMKAGHSLHEVAMPMNISPLSPQTFTFLEWIEGQKENRTGITRYNQGLDANSLNKMCDIHHMIPLANGKFKELKDIVDGDILVGQNGQPTTVVKAHEIQLPKKAYSIEFSNGEVIRAGGEHLWTIRNQRGVRKTVDTDYIFDYMSKYKQPVYIDRVNKPLAGIHKELPLDPYFLGLWLGDGGSWQNVFTTEDKEVLDYVNDWATSHGGYIEQTKHQNSGKALTYRIKDTNLTDICIEFGIRKTRYANTGVKHIPEIYFEASYEQRLELLRGLMDTDGCHHSGGFCIFTQKEGQLCDDVIRLVKSLGWDVTVHETNPCEFAKPNTKYFNIGISALDNPFKLSRKANKWKRQTRMTDKVKIKSITEIEPIPMRCLTVDAEDGQFCIEYTYTVTHNTATGISAILGQSSQRLELVARMFAETGLYELFRFMVSLNQKFIDQQTVIRLTNKEMKITPEDLDGSFDLIVNAGISISTKESTIMATQTLLTAIMQANAAGYMISTPENIYNLFKKWIESIGFKNYGDYITDPAISQQRMLIEIQLKQQVLSQLPPDAMQYYAQFGILPPQYLNMLPPQLQVLFRGAGNEPGTQEQTNVAGNFGGTGFGGTNLSGGLATGLSRVDNQQPQNVQRGPSQGPTEPSRGIGGF
jgi:putative portal protein|nr:MAG TPA: Portal protein [Caudoviricetes sp.]